MTSLTKFKFDLLVGNFFFSERTREEGFEYKGNDRASSLSFCMHDNQSSLVCSRCRLLNKEKQKKNISIEQEIILIVLNISRHTVLQVNWIEVSS